MNDVYLVFVRYCKSSEFGQKCNNYGPQNDINATKTGFKQFKNFIHLLKLASDHFSH